MSSLIFRPVLQGRWRPVVGEELSVAGTEKSREMWMVLFMEEILYHLKSLKSQKS